MSNLTIALPKGKLHIDALEMLAKAGLPAEGVSDEARTLRFEFADEGITYIMARPTDVPTYVEYGAADLGVVGKDVIEEQGKDVYEMADLGFGYCRFVVAVPRDGAFTRPADLNYRRVATKFPRVAAKYFRDCGLQVEVIKLHGNIELAPQMGLADAIVDIVSTGRTLKENNLQEMVTIMESTARLIVNRVSYRTQYEKLLPLVQKLSRIAKEVK
ncbi:MAG: ATP phosphoribosyltransferase [Methylocystaceae bacterium]